jgi:hypothetical protein
MNEDPELICRDRQVTVRQAPAFLDVFPEYIEVCRTQTVTISIRPPVDPRSARTEPASGNADKADWLRSESQDGETIVIKIPESAARDTTYKYSITIDGVGTLDPRFRIIR